MAKVKLYWSDGTTNVTTDDGVLDLLFDQSFLNIDLKTPVGLIKVERIF